MDISEFDFDLPEELIATDPLAIRDTSRLLHVDRGERGFTGRAFRELPDLLDPTDVLVINNTKVFPARLLGRSETGANAEVFLVREVSDMCWEALARPARRLPPGRSISFGPEFKGRILERDPQGRVIISFESEGPLEQAIERFGRTPLPPYIKRDRDGADTDRERYQTVYASERGAIAAPTAGLHFTPEVLERIRDRGVEVLEITLHVGYGTFEPVRVEDISKHRVEPERFSIDAETADRLNAARSEGRRIVAVGTTTTRALEYLAKDFGSFRPGNGVADLTILPGHKFRAVGAMLTNFHLPKSSLLILVATFGGYELIMDSYRHAVASRYRFYSYGDCMFIS